MSVRISLALFLILIGCGVCRAESQRWNNFAEDSELKYYIDQRSIISLPDEVFIFWVKSVPKDRDYFKQEYNQNDVAYMFTSYELDCSVSSYRVRGVIMYDKSRREVNKSVAEGEETFAPVPPESMLELAQEEICAKGESAAKESPAKESRKEAAGEHSAAAPVPPAAPEMPAPAPSEEPSLQ